MKTMKRCIRDRFDDLSEKLKTVDEKKATLERQLAALQAECPHQRFDSWTSGDFKGGSDLHWQCLDCGLTKIS